VNCTNDTHGEGGFAKSRGGGNDAGSGNDALFEVHQVI
jgi:hypothetical protein